MVENEWWKNIELREPEEFERRDALKLGSGIHNVKIENNGREVQIKWQEKSIPKIVFDVEYANKKFAWFVTKGETTLSLFGQLTKIGQQFGKLGGKEIKIVVSGLGKNKRYQIIEVDGKSVI